MLSKRYAIHGFCLHHTDENECETGNHECHLNADCNNTVGSYTCTCQEGYFGDGFQCAGIRTLITLPGVKICGKCNSKKSAEVHKYKLHIAVIPTMKKKRNHSENFRNSSI